APIRRRARRIAQVSIIERLRERQTFVIGDGGARADGTDERGRDAARKRTPVKRCSMPRPKPAGRMGILHLFLLHVSKPFDAQQISRIGSGLDYRYSPSRHERLSSKSCHRILFVRTVERASDLLEATGSADADSMPRLCRPNTVLG